MSLIYSEYWYLANVHFCDILHTFIPHFTLHSTEKNPHWIFRKLPVHNFPHSTFRKIPLPATEVSYTGLALRMPMVLYIDWLMAIQRARKDYSYSMLYYCRSVHVNEWHGGWTILWKIVLDLPCGLGRFQYMTFSVQRGGQFRYMMTSVHMWSISVYVFFCST